MPVIGAIRERHMSRRFTDRLVSDDIIGQLLDAAIRAPSPHNRQPWRFCVVLGDARVRLAQAMGDRLRSDLARDGAPPDLIEKDVSRSYQRITSAPALILACLSMADMDVYPDSRRNDAEHWMAGQAVAAAVQNILLAATELDLGACWMCAPLFCPDIVVTTLDLPANWEPQALIALGYPSEDDPSKRRGRKPIEAVSVWRK